MERELIGAKRKKIQHKKPWKNKQVETRKKEPEFYKKFDKVHSDS
jgi:hypothetical protein